jgi:uncharacterized membrane protein SirB2
MQTFSQVVAGWRDFYLMVGTAAATLVGLLFVSLSLNADAISRKKNADLRALAEQTFASFLFILMFAVFFLIPGQEPLGLGLPLLGVGLLAMYVTVRHFLLSRRHHRRRWGWWSVTSRFVAAAVCFSGLIAIAILLLLGNTGGLNWLVSIMILLIISASFNAWNLLLRLRKKPSRS